jgi:hypothetical protein
MMFVIMIVMVRGMIMIAFFTICMSVGSCFNFLILDQFNLVFLGINKKFIFRNLSPAG